MRPMRWTVQRALAAILCLSLAVWSVMPSVSHAPAMLDTPQEHARMIAEHGHSHGLEEDFFWALHGHGHEVADHDHSPAVVAKGDRSAPFPIVRDVWRIQPSRGGPSRVFRIERPPRA